MVFPDAVALNAKADARKHVVEALNTVNFSKSERIVRINAVGTGWEEDDLRAILSAKNLPDAFLVPKV
jgi:citrate lyase beta subunit